MMGYWLVEGADGVFSCFSTNVWRDGERGHKTGRKMESGKKFKYAYSSSASNALNALFW